MASSTTLMNAALVIVLLVMAMIAPESRAIACSDVLKSAFPCLGYLKNGGAVTPACCNAIRSLNSEITATPDRQIACACLKQAAQAYGINYGYASILPRKCNVDLGIKISASTDCSKYVSYKVLIC